VEARLSGSAEEGVNKRPLYPLARLPRLILSLEPMWAGDSCAGFWGWGTVIQDKAL
jgi:hypothetical protein